MYNQSNPYLTMVFFILSMFILAFQSYYNKVMDFYENQNPYEAFYAINAINLLMFGVIIKLNSIYEARNKK